MIIIHSSYKEASLFQSLMVLKTSYKHHQRSCGNNSNNSNRKIRNKVNHIRINSHKARTLVCIADNNNTYNHQTNSNSKINKDYPLINNSICHSHKPTL